jgi:hypothetical protein
LADNNEWIDLLVVNKTTTASGSASATFRCEKLPYISSVSPLKAKNGDEITISGSWFGSKVATSDIYFNTIKVNALSSEVKSWSETQIVLKVPIDATTGTISIKTKDASSNSVDFEIGKSVDFYIGFNKLKVNYIDQNNSTTSKTEYLYYTNVISESNKKITWNGNTFTYCVFLPNSRISIYDRTISATGILSTDQKTLLNLSYKQTGTNTYKNIDSDGSTQTEDNSYMIEFTVENVPNTSIDGSPSLNFGVSGAAIGNLKYKYSYSQKFINATKNTNGYKEDIRTFKSVNTEVNTDSGFSFSLQ